MARVVWTERAEKALEDILLHIAADDVNAALAVAGHINSAVARLAAFPESAPPFGLGLRRLSIPSLPYDCFYRLVGGTVQIITLRHNSRKPLQ